MSRNDARCTACGKPVQPGQCKVVLATVCWNGQTNQYVSGRWGYACAMTKCVHQTRAILDGTGRQKGEQ